ncbi:IS256 family transposase [Limosilactobacillus fermentum]|uniref:IS256 family transposase n=1 Tax=Limosilactobacillus fermentum TaxID=1613 RepID=UPI000B445F50|nr:transposase [Limosilactobacillus fermentum]
MPKVELNLEDDELKELLLGDRDKAMQSIMAKILDEILKSEATEQIKAKAYERSDERTNSRNGYRVRQLTTRVGTLELHVPKLRHGNFSTQLFKRYQRSEQAFDLALMEMVIQGVSTRKVAEITKKLCGTTFSKSTVSALCNNLDDQVLDFNRRPLTQKYAFVYADAILFKVHRGHVVTSNSLLVAIGMSKEGATYQYSCVVESLSGVELKLVFVSNRHHANNYLVLATTKTSLRPNEIIQLYGRRWQIETYFKAAKQYLRFDQTQVQKYDGLCGHLAMVMMTYDLLAWQERQERDDRTIGDLFYIMGEAMPDLNITEVLVWFVKTLQEFMEDEPIIPRNLLEGTVNQFIKHLPQSVAKQFQAA